MPPLIFGTSALGNLYVAMSDEQKKNIVQQCFEHTATLPVVFDSAGKYGAGLALESLGKSLKALGVKPDDVMISNKLGWLRTELKTPEPTFEVGVWKELQYDAVQKISYDGILECFEQGNQLLGQYTPQMVSVHDPDEYLATATNETEKAVLYEDIMQAYKALFDLKQQGKVKMVGVGAKDWRVVQRIASDISLDWVMIANSLTIKTHPDELLDFIAELKRKGCMVVNSAVFHAGFLTGGNYYDYRLVSRDAQQDQHLFEWRDAFQHLCKRFDINPAAACVQFALHVPGVASVALNTSNPLRVKENALLVTQHIPSEFWQEMKATGLVDINCSFI